LQGTFTFLNGVHEIYIYIHEKWLRIRKEDLAENNRVCFKMKERKKKAHGRRGWGGGWEHTHAIITQKGIIETRQVKSDWQAAAAEIIPGPNNLSSMFSLLCLLLQAVYPGGKHFI
jgi:hypothetical protein